MLLSRGLTGTKHQIHTYISNKITQILRLCHHKCISRNQIILQYS